MAKKQKPESNMEEKKLAPAEEQNSVSDNLTKLPESAITEINDEIEVIENSESLSPSENIELENLSSLSEISKDAYPETVVAEETFSTEGTSPAETTAEEISSPETVVAEETFSNEGTSPAETTAEEISSPETVVTEETFSTEGTSPAETTAEETSSPEKAIAENFVPAEDSDSPETTITENSVSAENTSSPETTITKKPISAELLIENTFSHEMNEEEVPPFPANPEEPDIYWPNKDEEEDSPKMQEIEEEVLSELEQIENELEKLEQEILAGEMESTDSEFIPESKEEKLAILEIEKLEEESKKQKTNANKLAREIIPPPINADRIEVYVPEYQRVEMSAATSSKEEGEEDDNPAIPVEEEDGDLQAELERIYETGVATELDEWDRQILLPVFENRLRMSKNSVKLSYSKLKNQILSYKGITASFQGPIENFRFDKKIVFRFAIKDDSLQLYCALDSDSIDNAIYPHKKAKGEHAKLTPIIFEIEDEISLKNAMEIIVLVAAKIQTQEREHYITVAFAERYPVNPNAVLLGQENKPLIEGKYDDDDDYAPISGEITQGIIEAKFGKSKLAERDSLKGKEILEDLRQTAKTIKAAVALTEPIVYFLDAAVNKEGSLEYLNVQQVLNDKFLGKIVPQMFFAVAEGSDRIEKLNFLSLEFAVEQCNLYPETRFVLALSCRLLIRDAVFARLIKNAKTSHGNLVLAFDCALLESLGDLGLDRIRHLRNEAGAMIMIDNSENAGMLVLTEYDFEYIRFDSRFYVGDSPRQKAHLEVMTGYAKSQNIKTTSINVATFKDAQMMVERGVDVVQGTAAAEPKRITTLAMKAAKKLPFSR